MSLYHFVGAKTEIGGVAEGDSALERFGQEIELSDELYRDVILGGGAVLPAAVFDSLGFTEQELSIYSHVESHADALPAFLEKKKKAQLAVHDIRLKMEDPPALAPKPLALKELEPAA